VPRLFAGKLPDLNFGTNGGRSADSGLVARALAATEGRGFSQVLDGRFRGGYITRHYGDPDNQVDAIQLELAQTTYMDEDAPETYDPDRAAPLIGTLTRLVGERFAIATVMRRVTGRCSRCRKACTYSRRLT
jgi:N-formylglutamate amidohydrolase